MRRCCTPVVHSVIISSRGIGKIIADFSGKSLFIGQVSFHAQFAYRPPPLFKFVALRTLSLIELHFWLLANFLHSFMFEQPKFVP